MGPKKQKNQAAFVVGKGNTGTVPNTTVFQKQHAKKKKTVVDKGINEEGHFYTHYDDGSYYIREIDLETGKTKSFYYNTGKGHVFYSNPKGGFDLEKPYAYYENEIAGKRKYFQTKEVLREHPVHDHPPGEKGKGAPKGQHYKK